MDQIFRISEFFKKPEYPALLEAGISAPAPTWAVISGLGVLCGLSLGMRGGQFPSNQFPTPAPSPLPTAVDGLKTSPEHLRSFPFAVLGRGLLPHP
jgi:hypothetical protein